MTFDHVISEIVNAFNHFEAEGALIEDWRPMGPINVNPTAFYVLNLKPHKVHLAPGDSGSESTFT